MAASQEHSCCKSWYKCAFKEDLGPPGMTGWYIDRCIHQLYPGGYAVCLHYTYRKSYKYLSGGSCRSEGVGLSAALHCLFVCLLALRLHWCGLLMIIFCRWMRTSGCSSCMVYVSQQLQLQLGVVLPSERVLVWHGTRLNQHPWTEPRVCQPHVCFKNQTFNRTMGGKVKGFQ